MLRDELLQDDEIKRFVKNGDFSEAALTGFLQEHVLHPDHYVTFTSQVAQNVVALSAPKFAELSRPKRFFLLKAIVKLMDVAMWLKMWEYQLSRPDAAEYWKGLPMPFFTPVSGMIEPLESMRWALQKIGRLYVGSSRLLLVEGESEAVFVRTVQWHTRASNFDVKVYAYGGRGAVQSLVHLIKDKNAAGVGVYLTYDKDGQAEDLVRTLRKRGCRISRSFAFPRDFESGFPPHMLALAVNQYAEQVAKVPLRLTVNEVIALLQDRKPFATALKASYHLELGKPRFAAILGILMSRDLEERGRWYEVFNTRPPKKAFRHHAYRFLKFIMS